MEKKVFDRAYFNERARVYRIKHKDRMIKSKYLYYKRLYEELQITKVGAEDERIN